MKKVDRTGYRYDRLLVIRFEGSRGTNNRKRPFWYCKCDCGRHCIVNGEALQGGNTRSCGCLKKESIASVNYKHGEANKTKEYRTWAKMRSRCDSPSDPKYPIYGGRGIKVCDRWLNSFEDFLSDMGRAPSPRHSIDRIDVNGGYSLENCRWATHKQQGNNTRSNVILTLGAESMNIKQWATKLGYNYKSFHKMLSYKGKTLEQMAQQAGYQIKHK